MGSGEEEYFTTESTEDTEKKNEETLVVVRGFDLGGEAFAGVGEDDEAEGEIVFAPELAGKPGVEKSGGNVFGANWFVVGGLAAEGETDFIFWDKVLAVNRDF